MLQVLGVRRFASFAPVMLLLKEEPKTVERVLDVYTSYLEELIDRVCRDVISDYAVFYEPIASNHAPVISPQMARRFLQPCYRRVCERLSPISDPRRVQFASRIGIRPLAVVDHQFGISRRPSARGEIHFLRFEQWIV
ncbi:MAG: hypothetical protein C4527_04750 [Candidatus Omnitrophota bacterium]|jgi:hypothetical protein|nr:MAG: hypothetical protein C4527_04750 [Candidatus Omnitrophota bacterium]